MIYKIFYNFMPKKPHDLISEEIYQTTISIFLFDPNHQVSVSVFFFFLGKQFRNGS